jgi:hypothetical protein
MDLPTHKACSTCGAVQPLDAYYRSSAATDGRQSRCKACHLDAVRRYREPDRDRWKRCSRCGERRPGTEFHRNVTTTDGLHGVCRGCNAPARAAQQEVDRRRRFRAYDITPEEVAALLTIQQEGCAICAAPFGQAPFNVDHDHASGAVRGLLCRACNTALGLLRDDASRLAAAIRYLAEPPLRTIREGPGSGGRYRT